MQDTAIRQVILLMTLQKIVILFQITTWDSNQDLYDF